MEMENTAWTLNDIIKKLCEATDILLHEKDYDGHGYEEMQICLTLAQKYLSTEQARSVVQPEVMPNEVAGGDYEESLNKIIDHLNSKNDYYRKLAIKNKDQDTPLKKVEYTTYKSMMIAYEDITNMIADELDYVKQHLSRREA